MHIHLFSSGWYETIRYLLHPILLRYLMLAHFQLPSPRWRGLLEYRRCLICSPCLRYWTDLVSLSQCCSRVSRSPVTARIQKEMKLMLPACFLSSEGKKLCSDRIKKQSNYSRIKHFFIIGIEYPHGGVISA